MVLISHVLSSINLIHWWMEQNSSQIESYLKSHSNETLRTYFASQGSAVAQRPDQNPIWKLLTTNATFLKFKGGWPHNVMDYFFNGYSPSAAHNPDRNLPSSFPTSPTEGGGLFYDVFGKSILTDLRAAKGFQADGEAMTKELDQGNGLIAIVGAAGGTHAITVWGTEYDETGRLCAVYVVDNNDTGRAQGADRITGTDDIIGMIRYNAFETDTHKLHLDSAPNIFGKQVLHNFAVLTLAQNGWEYFLQNGKPLYEEDGHAFLNPIKEAPPLCETHTFEVMHGGSKIVKHCKVCGYETGFLLSMGMDPQTTYTGQPLTPCQVSQINTSIYHRDFWYTDNINVGTATAHMTAIIDGTLYEATLNFQIKPQPAEPPTETPVQNGEAEIYGFSLQPIAGREFAVWPANRDLDPQAAQWREDGQFTDLLPDTQYQVYIRSLSSHPGDKNYTHSEPVKTALTVTTKSDAQLGEPSWSLETIAVQDGNVTVQVHNTGKRDTATLILAGYDGNDRQVMTHMQTVTAAGETVTVTVPGQGSARYKAFLLDDRSTPITPAKAS